MTFHRLSRKKRILQLKPKLTRLKYNTYVILLIYVYTFFLSNFEYI